MSGINFFELKCQRCGGELEELSDGVYTCAGCGKKWQKENLQGFTDMLEACEEALRAQRAADIAKLRRLLWTETHREFVSNIEVSRLCNEIKKYMPRDFYADFYLATCGNGKTELGDFLQTVNVGERHDDLPLILDYLLNALKPEWAMGVSNFIEKIKGIDVPLYNKYRTKFEEEYSKTEECVFEPSFPRDAFIAYSSADMPEVTRLVAALEEEKLTCFVSARNMRHGSGAADNYEKILQTAIDHCSVIVFVSSDNSRSVRCDAYRELDFVNKNCKSKPRVEYLVKDYSGRATERFFEEFFKGLEYCTSVKDAAARVCDIIQNNKRRGDQNEFDEPLNIPREHKQERRQKKETPQKVMKRGDYQISDYVLIKYKGKDTDIIIPDTVRVIDDKAFENCTLLNSVTLPDSITSIGEKAFYNCSSLKEINLPDSLISIGSCAFHTCRSLTSIIIPKSVLTIGSGLFGSCESLKKIYCMAKSKPVGWHTIASKWDISCNAMVLWGCDKEDFDTTDFDMDGDRLVSYIGYGGSVTVPRVVSEIADNAFGGNNTITNVTISDGVFTIGGFAFGHCSALKSVKISASVNSIGDYAFYGCTSLENIQVESGNKTYRVSDGNLYGGGNLVRYAAGKPSAEFNLKDKNVTGISNGAFSRAKTLKSVTLHKKLNSIGERAFIGCGALESIVIPKSVTAIGGDAFKDCTSLKTIYCRAGKKPAGWNKNWNADSDADVVWGYNRLFPLLRRALRFIKSLLSS